VVVAAGVVVVAAVAVAAVVAVAAAAVAGNPGSLPTSVSRAALPGNSAPSVLTPVPDPAPPLTAEREV
jgi:hypothetical protein